MQQKVADMRFLVGWKKQNKTKQIFLNWVLVEKSNGEKTPQQPKLHGIGILSENIEKQWFYVPSIKQLF